MPKPQPFILESLAQGFTSCEPTSCATKTTMGPRPAAAVIARRGLRRPSPSLKPSCLYKVLPTINSWQMNSIGYPPNARFKPA